MGPSWVDMLVFYGLQSLAHATATFAGVFLALFLILRRYLPKQSATEDKSLLEMVRERYARGEISRDEYERLREDLSETARS